MTSLYRGTVAAGSKQAGTLGFPTVNIPLEDPSLSGAYVTAVRIEEKKYPGAAFADQERKILEVHLLDFSEDMYGKEVAIEVLEKIRDRQKFPDKETAQARIAEDVAHVREYFKKRQQ